MDVPAMAETAAKRTTRGRRMPIRRDTTFNDRERQELARRLCEEITSFSVFTEPYGPIFTQMLFCEVAVQFEARRPGSGMAIVAGAADELKRRGLMLASQKAYHEAWS